MTRLERWYRLLMFAYPSDFDVEREEEIVTTLLALAKPGQQRPTIREAASLVVAGLGTRSDRLAQLDRSAGRKWSVLFSLFALTTIVVLVPAVHLRGEWADELPAAFVPLWASLGTFAVLVLAAPRLVRPTRPWFVAGGAAAVALGTPTMMAQRMLLVAVVWFIAVAACHLAATRQRHRVIAIVLGAAAGLAMQSRPSRWLSPSPRHHQAWLLHETLAISRTAGGIVSVAWIAIGTGAMIVSIRHPSLRTAYRLIALPTLLVLSILSGFFTDRASMGVFNGHLPYVLWPTLAFMAAATVADRRSTRQRLTPA